MPADLETVFPGDSELARRMRELDWSATALGPPEGWPENLRIALGICLTSRFPMHLWWGPDLTLLYNDAYVSFLGPKHPEALGRSGREVWAEIWHQICPMIEEVFATRTASWSEDIPMFFARALPAEEVYVTFSFSPVHDPGAGARTSAAQGLFCACTETTEKIIASRRLDTLRALGLDAAVAQTVGEAARAAADVLGKNPHDVPFAALYLVGDRGRAELADARGIAPERLPRTADPLEPDDAWRLAGALRDRRPIELAIAEQGVHAGPWADRVERALVMPIRMHDSIAGLLLVGVSPRRPLDAAYRTFFDLAAGHIGTALADARASEDERRRAEALAASRAKDELLGMLGHELRNPLSTILISLQVMRMTPGPAPDALELIERQVRHLTRMVDDLLDVSRLARGRIELHREPIDVADAIDRGLQHAGPLLEEGQHRVVSRVPRGIVIDADLHRLGQVFGHLLANAARYSPPGSQIELEAERTGDRVRVHVRDQGEGIAPELLGSVFDVFVQHPQALDRSRGGLGLGLPIARDIAVLHGGTIAAHSEGSGKGSVFTVELPVRPPGEPGGDAAGGPGPRAARARILVVDDNKQTTIALQAGLRLLGYTVETAHDGPSALQLAETFAPEVALLDIGLPGMDGYELARRLRERGELRLIAVTGYGQDADRARARAAGFEQHLVKPIDLRMVEAALSRVRRPRG